MVEDLMLNVKLRLHSPLVQIPTQDHGGKHLQKHQPIRQYPQRAESTSQVNGWQKVVQITRVHGWQALMTMATPRTVQPANICSGPKGESGMLGHNGQCYGVLSSLWSFASSYGPSLLSPSVSLCRSTVLQMIRIITPSKQPQPRWLLLSTQ